MVFGFGFWGLEVNTSFQGLGMTLGHEGFRDSCLELVD